MRFQALTNGPPPPWAGRAAAPLRDPGPAARRGRLDRRASTAGPHRDPGGGAGRRDVGRRSGSGVCGGSERQSGSSRDADPEP